MIIICSLKCSLLLLFGTRNFFCLRFYHHQQNWYVLRNQVDDFSDYDEDDDDGFE